MDYTGVGSLPFLQWIFPTQESNRDLLHCRWILYQLSYQGSLNTMGDNILIFQFVLKCRSLNFAGILLQTVQQTTSCHKDTRKFTFSVQNVNWQTGGLCFCSSQDLETSPSLCFNWVPIEIASLSQISIFCLTLSSLTFALMTPSLDSPNYLLDSLEEEMATQLSILFWRILWIFLKVFSLLPKLQIITMKK